MAEKNIQRTRKGSLLIEVLLSIVILSTTLTVVIQSMTASLRGTVTSMHYARAIFIGENEMQTLLMDQGGGMVHREIIADQRDAAYTTKVETSSLDDFQQDRLNKTDVSVVWSSKGKEKDLTLETYVFTKPVDVE